MMMIFRIFALLLTIASGWSSVSFAGTGAGVMMLFDDGTGLLGREMRKNGLVYGDFGGRKDPEETLAQTGWREGNEETAQTLKKQLTLALVQQAEANGHFVDHHHAATGNSYRMYFVRIHGKKPAVAEFHKNAATVKKKLGKKAHVEKDEWKYFDASVIKNAPFQNGNLPGTNEPAFGPLKACLRQVTSQNYLQQYINSVQNPPAQKPANLNVPQKKKVKGSKVKRTSKRVKKPVKQRMKKTRALKRKKTVAPKRQKRVSKGRRHRR